MYVKKKKIKWKLFFRVILRDAHWENKSHKLDREQ